jgi:hypothetical protein
MTEQEFKTTIEQLLINRTKRKGDPSWMKTSILGYAKVYAAAQVAETQERLTCLEHTRLNERGKNLEIISEKDAEIAELTRKLELQDTMHANAEVVLKEENKRLREGIAETVKYIKGPHHSNPEPIAIYEILQHIISPSDGDGETKAAPVVDENGLLPCPFCGGEMHVVSSSNGYTARCYGRNCPCNPQRNSFYQSPEEAKIMWNDRAGRGIEG